LNFYFIYFFPKTTFFLGCKGTDFFDIKNLFFIFLKKLSFLYRRKASVILSFQYRGSREHKAPQRKTTLNSQLIVSPLSVELIVGRIAVAWLCIVRGCR
jgi:hypothetical protein